MFLAEPSCSFHPPPFYRAWRSGGGGGAVNNDGSFSHSSRNFATSAGFVYMDRQSFISLLCPLHLKTTSMPSAFAHSTNAFTLESQSFSAFW